MRVLVMGATGGSGREVVAQLLAQGHEVTAFSRRGEEAFEPAQGLSCVRGDAMDEQTVRAAVRGHDAVVVTLGISENPLRVRMFGPARTPIQIRSRGTRIVAEAMHGCGVKKLVVQSSYGVGPTRDKLRWMERVFFKLLLEPQIVDTEAQERVVRGSGLEWVLVQPVHLGDVPGDEPALSLDGATQRMTVSRRSVAKVLVKAMGDPSLLHQTVAVSGAC